MRKIIISTMMSLDAVMENPHLWSMEYMNEEGILNYVSSQLFAVDALIMGRATYEGFAEAWSSRAGADEFADRMNSLPKYVASRSLKNLVWNSTLLKENIAEDVARIKQEPGQDILQYGIGELSQTLLKHGLVDELRFIVYPVIVGSGERILEKIDQTKLKLIETKTFSSGVLALHYQPQYT
jgi:dihydrofolate reductase